jgi:hypothetical protein
MALPNFARAAFFPALLLLVSACRREPERLDPVPAALEGRVAVARAAAADLKRTLSQRLRAAIKKEGLERAVDVCATEASKLTGEVAARHGVQIGRSSSRCAVRGTLRAAGSSSTWTPQPASDSETCPRACTT